MNLFSRSVLCLALLGSACSFIEEEINSDFRHPEDAQKVFAGTMLVLHDLADHDFLNHLADGRRVAHADNVMHHAGGHVLNESLSLFDDVAEQHHDELRAAIATIIADVEIVAVDHEYIDGSALHRLVVEAALDANIPVVFESASLLDLAPVHVESDAALLYHGPDGVLQTHVFSTDSTEIVNGAMTQEVTITSVDPDDLIPDEFVSLGTESYDEPFILEMTADDIVQGIEGVLDGLLSKSSALNVRPICPAEGSYDDYEYLSWDSEDTCEAGVCCSESYFFTHTPEYSMNGRTLPSGFVPPTDNIQVQSHTTTHVGYFIDTTDSVEDPNIWLVTRANGTAGMNDPMSDDPDLGAEDRQGWFLTGYKRSVRLGMVDEDFLNVSQYYPETANNVTTVTNSSSISVGLSADTSGIGGSISQTANTSETTDVSDWAVMGTMSDALSMEWEFRMSHWPDIASGEYIGDGGVIDGWGIEGVSSDWYDCYDDEVKRVSDISASALQPTSEVSWLLKGKDFMDYGTTTVMAGEEYSTRGWLMMTFQEEVSGAYQHVHDRCIGSWWGQALTFGGDWYGLEYGTTQKSTYKNVWIDIGARLEATPAGTATSSGF